MSTGVPVTSNSPVEEVSVVAAPAGVDSDKPVPPYSFEIVPEPSPEEASVICVAVLTIIARHRPKAKKSARTYERLNPAVWKAARRPRPTPHLIRGIEPSIAWRLSGLIAKPFGR